MTLDADDRMSPARSGTTTCGERLDVPSDVPSEERLLTPAALLASRTALTSIIGYAELLIAEDEGGWPQRLRMLRAIEQNGHRLYALLNHSSTDPPERLDGLQNLQNLEGLKSLDLLDGPRDGQGVDISELLDQVRLHVVHLLSDLEPYVTIAVPPGLWMHHQAAAGLRLVTRHLVENAVKYSRPRSPVEVEATPAGTLLSLRVSDSGVGIPPDEHTKVFERFYRSAYALEQRIPGHGVGLTTVRNIVLRQGGAIDLRSAPSAGTTVTVTLPLGLPLVTTSALADPDA